MGTRADEDLENVNVDEVDEEELERGHAGPGSKKKGEGRKYTTTKITVGIDEDLAQRLRSAVYHIPGLTMWQIVEAGIENVLNQIEEKTGGIPQFDGKLDGGPDPDMGTSFDVEDFFS